MLTDTIAKGLKRTNLNDISLGKNYLTIVIDRENYEAESDENNNQSQIIFTIINSESNNTPATIIPILELLLSD